jgi:ABC-2 type transport system ATP-binding protein
MTMTPALAIDKLRKTYRNGHVALKGISLEVGQGDFFALLGPNGAGKTTAIGIVTSLVNKTAGTVKIFGHDIDTGGRRNTCTASACGRSAAAWPASSPAA